MIVFIHFIRAYGRSGFKVEMWNLYCTVKEVLSTLYIISHWTSISIMIYITVIDNKIDGNILLEYIDDDHVWHYDGYAWPSKVTHPTTIAYLLYSSIGVYFLSGLYNTKLAIELFRDRGR